MDTKNYSDFDIDYFFETWHNGNKSHAKELFQNAHPILQNQICFIAGQNNMNAMYNFITSI